jgi:methylthioxylose transferase
MENQSHLEPLPKFQAVSLILTFCSISALFIYMVISRNFIFGSIKGNWLYEYLGTTNRIPIWIPIITLLLLGVFIFIGSNLIRKHEKLTLLGCLLVSITIQVLIHSAYPIPMSKIITSDAANSFYTPALQYSPIKVLSEYQDLAPTLPKHAKTNMPGKILFYQLLNIFTESPQILGYMIILISTLGGVILYCICIRLFRDKTLALYSFVLYTLIPCKLFFFPILNTVTPVFILICMYLFLVYLDSKNNWLLILLGFALYILLLFEPSPFITGFLFIGILLNAIGEKRISMKQTLSLVLIPIFSFVAIYLLFLFVFSFDLNQAFQYILKDAVEFNLIRDRNYLIWIGENLKETFYVAGLPVMMIFIYFVFSIFSQWRAMKKSLLYCSAIDLFVLSLLLTFSVTLFLGINRGEVTRLWIYLAVLFQIPASFFMAKIIKSNALFFVLAVTLTAQSFITLMKISFLTP